MKKTYCHSLLFLFVFGVTLCSNAQIDTLVINHSFTQVNINTFAKKVQSSEGFINEEDIINSVGFENDPYLFIPIEDDIATVFFRVKNATNEKKELILELNNSLLNHIDFYQFEGSQYTLINQTGTNFAFNSRPINDRNFVFPINLSSQETKAYALQFKKDKISVVVPSTLWSKKNYDSHTKRSYLIIGIYFGISVISILFSLYIFSLVKLRVYLVYALYIIFLGLYLYSFLGLFFQYFIAENEAYNKYIHVFFVVCTTIFFVLFSQNILNAKVYAPKIKKALDVILIIVILTRFSDFVLPHEMFLNIKPFVMRLWYFSFFAIIGLLLVLIYKSYPKQKKITLFYLFAFSFIGTATIFTIINVNNGALFSYVYGIPLILYASLFEIIFLTFTLVLTVKNIYDERNALSVQLVEQQKGLFNAFILGEERERERISKELHDHIGSRLGYLKRFVIDTVKNDDVAASIDEICNDLRDISHDLSPSDLTLVGFESSVEELCQKIASETTLTVNFNSHKFPEALNHSTSTNLYRVVQEAFNNIMKHSEATQVDVQLFGHDDHISISIEDNGKGFEFSVEKGLGFKNMSSRIGQIHGELNVDSKPNKGTFILINIPV
ncbi:7TM diverse intracellular signaling domain-containing protein [Psychroserpens sp. XS_ASV72]|uniref:sensor histidine kinase n=1 Tax=Psychroserpens sp. XS_ASV72 TaxID=3241293 RepID=UPI003512C612